jgi:hypothetical protein
MGEYGSTAFQEQFSSPLVWECFARETEMLEKHVKEFRPCLVNNNGSQNH